MFEKLKGVEDRFHELERLLSDPKVVQDGTPIKNIFANTRRFHPLSTPSGSLNGLTANWMTALNCWPMMIPK
jgi:3-methyladenine DNA glycosylase Tag